jgi:glycerophosphoryl diester phosphodiesterase
MEHFGDDKEIRSVILEEVIGNMVLVRTKTVSPMEHFGDDKEIRSVIPEEVIGNMVLVRTKTVSPMEHFGDDTVKRKRFALFCYTITMPIPLVIAHRGDSAHALENSLEAIHRALSFPVDMIEIDIRLSRDNVLYVMHDRMTGRTAEQNIDIERTMSDRIDTVKLRNGEQIPTLADVIKAVAGSAGLNLEIKSDGAGLLTAQYLATLNYKGYILISSFKEDEILAVQRHLPSLPTSLIFDVFTVRDVPGYKARGYKIISLRKKTVTRELIDACHNQGIQIYVWTVDAEEEMKQLASWGVDGIYSNRPGVLKDIVQSVE